MNDPHSTGKSQLPALLREVERCAQSRSLRRNPLAPVILFRSQGGRKFRALRQSDARLESRQGTLIQCGIDPPSGTVRVPDKP